MSFVCSLARFPSHLYPLIRSYRLPSCIAQATTNILAALLLVFFSVAMPVEASEAQIKGCFAGLKHPIDAVRSSVDKSLYRWPGITDPRIFDYLAKQIELLHKAQLSTSERNALDWIIKALTWSGNRRYLPLFGRREF